MPRIDLLVLDRAAPETSIAVARFGGTPLVPPGFAWPACHACHGHMRYLCTIAEQAQARRHLVFMCQNSPGMCDEWNPDSGGNAVLPCEGADLLPADLPAQGNAIGAARHAARVETVEAAGYEDACARWAEAHPGRGREVLGQIGGAPDWLQGDETPACDHCGRALRFVARLEEGPEHGTAMNFGGGAAYLFACDCTWGGGKFLWQC
ncbi:hypothetical protein [Roseomonas sp. CECT 9278]|uniref:hypothetical protein n=1 Tax=Roseomonas sp. CECT 9278 TaxID=2845823 RepID=UPI001E5FC823|nr:hypothetical protein [Roseomonas sp. CECT 9278]CAH0235730.1 hypothetical protein ROS9278_02765 [Roseomonas sp. CECT 9278]